VFFFLFLLVDDHGLMLLHIVGISRN